MSDAVDDAIDREELMAWVRSAHDTGHTLPMPPDFEGYCPFCERDRDGDDK